MNKYNVYHNIPRAYPKRDGKILIASGVSYQDAKTLRREFNAPLASSLATVEYYTVERG